MKSRRLSRGEGLDRAFSRGGQHVSIAGDSHAQHPLRALLTQASSHLMLRLWEEHRHWLTSRMAMHSWGAAFVDKEGWRVSFDRFLVDQRGQRI